MPGRKTLIMSGLLALAIAVVAACGGEESPFATTAPAPTPGVSASGGDAVNGEVLFKDQGCGACHSTGGDRIIGPGLAGVSARRDDAFIRQSITDPAAVITEGFTDLMPNTFGGLPDSDIEDLVAYLKTLQ